VLRTFRFWVRILLWARVRLRWWLAVGGEEKLSVIVLLFIDKTIILEEKIMAGRQSI
jgi:hypothetical protein